MQTADTNLKSRTDAVMNRIMEESTEEKFSRSIDEYEMALAVLRIFLRQNKTTVCIFDFQRRLGLGFTIASIIMFDLVELGVVQRLDNDSESSMMGDRNILI